MKDFFLEIFMWWIDWLSGGQAYDLVWRLVLTIFFLGLIGLAIWMAFWGQSLLAVFI